MRESMVRVPLGAGFEAVKCSDVSLSLSGATSGRRLFRWELIQFSSGGFGSGCGRIVGYFRTLNGARRCAK